MGGGLGSIFAIEAVLRPRRAKIETNFYWVRGSSVSARAPQSPEDQKKERPLGLFFLSFIFCLSYTSRTVPCSAL